LGDVIAFRKRKLGTTFNGDVTDPNCGDCGKPVMNVSVILENVSDEQRALPRCGLEMVYICIRCACGARIRVRGDLR
jgi:hypothetical protein